ncbi:ABC transporter permease [Longispora albida]|uniref:ABC transporter permease n=1 Tax=Longispora albida TaxID=203523 RepID=UPI000368ED3E|nr:ABC-2 family transporter protein [Longispora albida]
MANPYVKLLGAQIRSQLQYRASFFLDLSMATLLSAVDIGALFLLFRVTPALGGFGWREVILMTAISGAGFCMADLAVGEIERLKHYIRTGLLDTVLLRPMSALGQLLVLDFATRRAGRVVQGTLFYLVALTVAPVKWDAARVVYAIVAPINAAVFFSAVFVTLAAIAFWWIESGDIANAFTYGGRDFTAYPSTMFHGWFRGLFAFGLGFAFVAYLPALALLGLSEPIGLPDWARWCSPLVTLVVVLIARATWLAGLRRYGSTGS